MPFKIGDYVRVPGNAKGTTWEYGQIKAINNQGALIDYSPPHGVYGMGMRVPLNGLEHSSEKTVKGSLSPRKSGGGPIHVRSHARRRTRGVRAHTRRR